MVYPFILILFYCKLFGQTFYFNYSLEGLQGCVIFTPLKRNQHIFRIFMSTCNWWKVYKSLSTLISIQCSCIMNVGRFILMQRRIAVEYICLSVVQQSFSYIITHNLNVFIYNDFHQFLFYSWNLSDPFGASINC